MDFLNNELFLGKAKADLLFRMSDLLHFFPVSMEKNIIGLPNNGI